MAKNDKKSKTSRAMTGPRGGTEREELSRAERDELVKKYEGVSFEDACANAENFESGGGIDKNVLVGEPLVILDARWKPSTKGPGDFAIILAKGKNAGTVVFTDGGSGVSTQLREHMDKGGTLPLLVRQGLKRNDYKVTVNGKEIDAHTFWLNGAPSNAEVGAAVAVGKTGRSPRANGARAS